MKGIYPSFPKECKALIFFLTLKSMSQMNTIPHLQYSIMIVIKNDFVGSLTEEFLQKKKSNLTYIHGLRLIVLVKNVFTIKNLGLFSNS